MVFTDKYRDRESFDDVLHIAAYYAYWLDKATRTKNPKFDLFSGLVLDVKDNKDRGKEHFRRGLSDVIAPGVPIARVPSHDPAKAMSGLRALAQSLAADGRIDATGCLVRHTFIPKLATGGSREMAVHLNSIRVDDAHLVVGQDVLLMDDVTTSGNSLKACKQLLLQAGAARVLTLALGKTAS